MHRQKLQDQLLAFKNLRQDIDQSKDPLVIATRYWLSQPFVRYTMDPWDPNTWPSTPWELIQEKELCKFGRILGLCYTLQLTETFSQDEFKIIIGIDRERSDYQYIVSVRDFYIGFDGQENGEPVTHLPSDFVVETIHTMPRLQ